MSLIVIPRIASLIATSLATAELILWKEVDGIYTADPNIVPEARAIGEIDWREALEMAVMGSEVVHPLLFSKERQEAGISMLLQNRLVTIRNSQKPDLPGTTIVFQQEDGSSDSVICDKPQCSGVTGITLQKGISVISVTAKFNPYSNQPTRFLARLFGLLQTHGIRCLLISTSHEMISIAVPSEDALDPFLQQVDEIALVAVRRNLAIVSIIGSGMRAKPGIAGKFFSTLALAKINIEMISQGASEINVSCVVQETCVIEAVKQLHRALID
jgi:aspartate kinase